MNDRFEFGQKVAWIRHFAGDGSSSSSGGTRQQCSGACALPSFEVAIARADCVLAFIDEITIHADAHRAARLAPLGTCIRKDFCEAPCFGFALDLLRAGNDQSTHAGAVHAMKVR